MGSKSQAGRGRTSRFFICFIGLFKTILEFSSRKAIPSIFPKQLMSFKNLCLFQLVFFYIFPLFQVQYFLPLHILKYQNKDFLLKYFREVFKHDVHLLSLKYLRNVLIFPGKLHSSRNCGVIAEKSMIFGWCFFISTRMLSIDKLSANASMILTEKDCFLT